VRTRLLAAMAAASLVSCSAAPDVEPEAAVDGARSDALIGGRQASPGEFPATVHIWGNCTAAKVGPRHILTAAHCVHEPYGNTLDSRFQAGGTIWITAEPAPQPSVDSYRSVQIAQTYLAPGWLETCVAPCRVNVLNSSHPADVAVIELATDTPDIPEAEVDLGAVVAGDPVVITGYGCEESLNAPFDYDTSRLKLEQLVALPVSALLHPGSYVWEGNESNIAASYVVTAGVKGEASAASLCPGDSGGPLYRADAGQRTVVGVNAYYTFVDSDGRSQTNWHTRLDIAARYGIGAWLRTRGVNVIEDASCVPACSGKSCGADGCGGECGSCASGETCSDAGQCIGPLRGCAGVPDWSEAQTFYALGEQRTRGGNLYECTHNGHCFRDPAGPWGHFGWTLRGPC
jgi:hypothetical protein